MTDSALRTRFWNAVAGVVEGPARESAADAQRRYAQDNDATADRLDAAGHGDLASVYRDTAGRHRQCAERIARGETWLSRGPLSASRGGPWGTVEGGATH